MRERLLGGVSIARIPSQAPLEELDEPAVGALQHLCEVFCAREASLSPGVGRRARRAGRVEEMFAAAGAIERGALAQLTTLYLYNNKV